MLGGVTHVEIETDRRSPESLPQVVVADPERRRDPARGHVGAPRAGQDVMAPAGAGGERDELHLRRGDGSTASG